MVLRLALLVSLVCLTAAGPVAWDESKCSQKCNGGSKYQYSPQTSYIYTFESSNEMHADGATDLSMGMKATIVVTAVTECEMVLQITDVTLKHGPEQETSSTFIEQLKRNPLPFSWDDGRIEYVCPNPDDSNDLNNIKKAILSSFQNTMKSHEHDTYVSEVDVLGACDTNYKVKDYSEEEFVVLKDKNIASCSNHLKGQSLLLASSYNSFAQRQHLPFLSGEKLSCSQVVNNGIVEKVTCDEKAAFKPLYDYGYVVEVVARTQLEKLSSAPAAPLLYRTSRKESLVFKYETKSSKDPGLEQEAKNILQNICEMSDGLISKEAASYVHKLVYTIRRLDKESLETLYRSLKSKELCASGKALTIYLDALKAASSGGSIALLSNLVANGDISELDSLIWITSMPFTSYVEEESIAAALPLLKKDTARRQALLGVSAMTYKYCTSHSDCDDIKAVKDISSSLKQFLGDKCSTSNEEEQQVLTALKSFGNLGYIGDSADAIFECASASENKISIRIAAVEAFRRTPCSEKVIAKLMEMYKNKQEDDEVRIAALISLSRCATSGVIRNVLDQYLVETSKQVQVFTWSYLENLRSSHDPLKQKLRDNIALSNIKEPYSTDITKFSRNFEWSFFSELLNLGHGIGGNIIHSRDSFLPRSGNIDLKVDIFGNQLDLLEAGLRVEDLEHILEKIFGPRGLMPNLEVEDVLALLPESIRSRKRRSADSHKAKIDTLSERYGYKRNKVPHGSGFIRVLGHELGWLQLNKDSLKGGEGIDIKNMLKNLASIKNIDKTKNLLFLDVAVLFPSITGRAYKLAANGSITLGLKASGKIDIQQPHLPIPRADINGRFQPSILGEATASFTIHSEDFEPGVKVETTANAGVDLEAKFELKDARLLHVKLNRPQERSEIFSIKRTLFLINHKGKSEMPKPESYHLDYCTKYVQYILGVRYCAAVTIPHIYNAEGKPKIPFVRALEGSLVVEKTDDKMEGYEILIELPQSGEEKERKYKILFDTPRSEINRKLSAALTVRNPDPETHSASLKLYSPFYSVEVDGSIINQDKLVQMKLEALGDRRRRYGLSLDIAKDVRGARLVEFAPKLTLFLPNTRPIELTGTIAFAKGHKEQITINLESKSFNTPFTIKGNMAKEGGNIDLDSDWKLRWELNVNAFTQIHKVQSGIGNIAGKGIFIDLGHHYEPDGRSYESITLNAKIENIVFRERLGFTFDSKVLLAEHQDLNTMLKWDFSIAPLRHLRSDVIFRYGENFDDDKHLVRMVIAHGLHGDLDTFQKMHIENKIGLTISCFDFDKSAALTAIWDVVEKPKAIFEVGFKSASDEEIKLEFNYSHLSSKPRKLSTKIDLILYDYKFQFRDEAHEVTPGEYEGHAIIEPREEKKITVDYAYKIKSTENLHHEFDGTIQFPGRPEPVKQKITLEYKVNEMHLNSFTDTGSGTPYEIDLKWRTQGLNEASLKTPYVEGSVNVDTGAAVYTVQADFKAKGKEDRRVIVSGSVSPGKINIMDLNIQWDADKDSEQKVSLNGKSYKETEEGIEKHMVTASINYAGSINVDVTGKISTDLLRGPHYFRADFSGNMEPMAVECNHEIKNGHMTSVAKYLRSGSEKLRSDINGKFIQRAYNFELEGGMSLSSPYKTFDGKELYFRIMADSSDATRLFISEYRIKPAAKIGYTGKLDYERKRGWPGHIKSNLLVTRHQLSLYEGHTNVDYGNGKYSFKTSFTPITKRKLEILSTFEHAARFAAFHHSMATSLRYLQKVEVNAIADLRSSEDAKIQSNIDLNQHNLYDINSTLKMRSVIDFDGQIVILSKITPSLHIFSKTQTQGHQTKYEMNLDVDSVRIITGSGEIKKRKKVYNGDLVFKYREKELAVITISQEAKSQRDRNYAVKIKAPTGSYSSSVRINKEKKGDVKYETQFCAEKCVHIDAHHMEHGEVTEWQITYKRGDIEFNIERIRVSTNELSRFHTVIYKGDKRYGYDLRVGKQGSARSLSLGIVLPSRVVITKGTFEFSLSNPKAKLELALDGRNHPDRNLITDIRLVNHLTDDNPSKLDIIISHPIFEKPVELQLIADYKSYVQKYFTAEMYIDYSTDPEDKLIGKLSLERAFDGEKGSLLLEIYHKDSQNLDFVIKANRTINANENTFWIVENWKDDKGAEKEAHVMGSYLKNERKMHFVYERPKLSYQLDGSILTQQDLLNDTCEMDITSIYNGVIKKAKLIVDNKKSCKTLVIFNDKDEKTRIIELCADFASRKLISVISEGTQSGGHWAIDFALEIIQKNWRTLGVKHQWNPDFLGAFLFKLTSLADELEAAGLGTLPLTNSPRFKKIKSTFKAKVLKPAYEYVIPEVRKFFHDIRDDFSYLGFVIINYYHRLPPLPEVKRHIANTIYVIKRIGYEAWTTVESYYKNYFRNVIRYVDSFIETVRAECHNNADCRSLVRAFNDGGWRELLIELRKFLLSLPEKIHHFLEEPSEELQNLFRKVMKLIKDLLHPLTEYRCGEIIVKVVQLIHQAVEPHVQKFYANLPGYYRTIKQAVSTNPYVVEFAKLVKKEYLRAREYIMHINYRQIYIKAIKYIEDYLSTANPPSLKPVTVNYIDGDRGYIDFDVRTNLANKIGYRIGSIVGYIANKAVYIYKRYTWNTLLVKFKRVADLNFFPPYEADAMIVGNQYFVTFDKEFYDFAGECTYLLSKDFQDGNFTFILKPKEGDNGPSVVALINDVSVELNSKENSVKVSDNAVDLPYLSQPVAVTRRGSTVTIDDKYGVKVKCNLVHNICTFSISGWYFGKTAGLFGTYNYEPSDDFKRPKGQIANSAAVLAKSWELKKGCKPNNLLPDVRINEKSDYFKLCKSHFVDDNSPLAACFYEVDPKEYFQLCLRHLARESDSKKGLCNVASAYVMECESNYVELNLPAKCLTCEAPDGSQLQHGYRKKYENLRKKAADVVFLVEDHECNKAVLGELDNLARSIDRELQSEGFKDNLFGVVGFGGDIGSPQIYTAGGKILFNSRDIGTLTGRIKMENEKTESSRAFEAMKLALNNLFRGENAKSFVLLSCSPCKFDIRSLQYPVIQQILLERGITLHVINNAEISTRKSKEKNIIGVDPDTVYHGKDVTQKDLVGEPALRSQVSLPKDLCIALSQDVGGSFFSTHSLSKQSSTEIKNWRSVFARKFLKATQSFQCQWCDCTSTRDHIPNTICQPCEIKRPRLPFSVCRSCAYSRTADAFFSYLLQLSRM